jgi:hypothetical protein
VTDRESLLVRAAALTYLAEQVGKAQAEVRTQLMTDLKPGERHVAALVDGTVVGKVVIGEAPATAAVTDEAAFLRWVEETRPDEIVGMVRSSYRTAVLTECKKRGAPCTADGELIPGVVVGKGSASYRPTYNADALPAMLDAVRANRDLALSLTS